MGADFGKIVMDVSRHIVRGVFIFVALAVNIRLHQAYRFHSCSEGNENDIIHARQSSKCAGPHVITETRTPRPFIDMLPVCHRHYEKIAQSTSFLQMNDVAGVDEIKSSVTLNNTSPVFTLLIKDSRGLLKGENFTFIHLRGSERALVTWWQTSI